MKTLHFYSFNAKKYFLKVSILSENEIESQTEGSITFKDSFVADEFKNHHTVFQTS